MCGCSGCGRQLRVAPPACLEQHFAIVPCPGLTVLSPCTVWLTVQEPWHVLARSLRVELCFVVSLKVAESVAFRCCTWHVQDRVPALIQWLGKPWPPLASSQWALHASIAQCQLYARGMAVARRLAQPGFHQREGFRDDLHKPWHASVSFYLDRSGCMAGPRVVCCWTNILLCKAQ